MTDKNNCRNVKPATLQTATGMREDKILKCSCGAEILIVPDVKAMSKAIENHVAEHKVKGTSKLHLLRQTLIEELFIKISE